MPVDNLIPLLFSPTPNTKPLVSTRLPGELWTNFPDLQLGLIDATQTSVPLIAVRYFSAATAYVGGDFVIQGGKLYVAKAVVPIGAFNATQWTALQTAADIAAGYLPLTGGTLSGPLTLAANPTVPLGAATKQYSDLKLPLTGGTLTGSLAGTDAYFSGGVNAAGVQATGGVSGASLSVNGPASAPRAVYGFAGGSNRWVMYLGTPGTEGAGNTGSDFQLSALDNNGVFTFSPLSISRSTGNSTFYANMSILNAGIDLLGGGNVTFHKGGQFQQVIWMNGGSQVAQVYYDYNSSTLNVANITGGASINIDPSKNITFNGQVRCSAGYQTKPGVNGAYTAHQFNFDWVGAMQGWMDTTNLGNVTFASDYRIKQNVAPLPGMWERLKALNPISYEHKDYTPTGAPTTKEDGSALDPMFVADGKERWGFIAHELQETLIEDAASGVKDGENLIQSPNPWTMLATVVKALQEAMARIEALEARGA